MRGAFFQLIVATMLAGPALAETIVLETSETANDSVPQVIAEDQPSDFRATHWGMKPEEVKAMEPGQTPQENEKKSRLVLAYSDTVVGLECRVVYIFADSALFRAKYLVSEKHTNKNDYEHDYTVLREALQKKYGKPNEDKTVWRNNLYRDDPANYGMAVSVGHLAMWTKWETARTTVFLMIKGENFEINVGVEYSSKALQSIEAKAKERDEKGKL